MPSCRARLLLWRRGWQPKYDLAAMTKVMLDKVQQRMQREAEKAAARQANGGAAARGARATVAAVAVPASLA